MPRPVHLINPVNRAHPQARGLVAWWLTLPGLAGGRQWHDLCGLNPGTLTNMGVASGWRGTTRPGGLGHLLFDGVDDHVVIGSNASLALTTGTLCAWVNFQSVAKNMRVLDQSTIAWIGIINVNTNLGGLLYDGVNKQIDSGVTPTPGQWYHLTLSFDGATARFYINGAPSGSIAAGNPNYLGAGWRVDVGSFSTVSGGFANASTDDCRIYNRALSNTEVRALYDNSRLGYPGLLRRWGPAPRGGSSVIVPWHLFQSPAGAF